MLIFDQLVYIVQVNADHLLSFKESVDSKIINADVMIINECDGSLSVCFNRNGVRIIHIETSNIRGGNNHPLKETAIEVLRRALSQDTNIYIYLDTQFLRVPFAYFYFAWPKAKGINCQEGEDAQLRLKPLQSKVHRDRKKRWSSYTGRRRPTQWSNKCIPCYGNHLAVSVHNRTKFIFSLICKAFILNQIL